MSLAPTLNSHAKKGAALELQDLLNGIEEKQGKAVFLAFAQHDPVTLAGNLALQGPVRESLAKALTRIPKRYVLFSLMESVIDAYLMQNEAAWQTFVQDPKVRGNIYQATDVAFDQFQARYQRELRWSFEKFQETVAKRLFPSASSHDLSALQPALCHYW